MSDHDDSKRPEQPTAARKLMIRHQYESLIDQIVNKAQADGLMDNLPGQGQPLRLEDEALVPDEYRLGNRMLKASGFAPPWIEAQREIEQERIKLDTWQKNAKRRLPHLEAPARAALKVTYRRKLDDLQRMITNYNLQAPPGAPHLVGLRMADELAKLDE
jgi:DnaJ homologue, subfamily C, member 28, conserved domain